MQLLINHTSTSCEWFKKSEEGVLLCYTKLMSIFEKFRKKTEQTPSNEQNPWSELEQMPSFSERQENGNEENLTGNVEIQNTQEDLANDIENQEADGLEELEFEKMLESVSSPAEKIETLTFENMSKLSTKQYMELWKKLNPFYITHITRQGVRDHVGMFYHSAGSGELQDGFKGILGDDKILRSPAEVRFGIKPGFTKEDVEKFIDENVTDEQLENSNADTILEGLPVNSTIAAADPWTDRQAIHFAQHTVLNEYYGSETGNEIFFVYPTDVIASQCKFGGHMHKSLTTAQVKNEREWNDIFVWPKDGNIPVDAGLVFLPEDTMVDPNTGSRFAIDEKGEIEIDEDRIMRFTEWAAGLTPESLELVDAADRKIGTLENKLKELGIPEDKISEMVANSGWVRFLTFAKNGSLGGWAISEEDRAKMSKMEIAECECREYLEKNNAHMKFAENVVSSKEYWETYFAEHPDERPAHVVYYTGDPSAAVRDLLEESQILEKVPSYGYNDWSVDHKQTITGPSDTSDRDGVFLGFDENYIGDGADDEELKAEHERFNQLALEIIREKQSK